MFRRKGQQAENDKTERVTTRQKNKRGDSKVETNDSPEVPERGKTSDIPGLPWEGKRETESMSHKRAKEKRAHKAHH